MVFPRPTSSARSRETRGIRGALRTGTRWKSSTCTAPKNGLRGAQGGKTVHRLVVHLQDERYIYTVRLDATSAEALRAAELPFLQVTHSIVPVPSPARRVVNLQADAMSMWL